MDAARGVALLGMVAVHVVDPTTAANDPHPVFLGFAGRASVLFVLLAGVGLALSTGGTRPAEGARRAALRRRITRRAGLLFVVGLACGALGTPVAVILCHYALLFLLALPLLGLRAPALGAIAGAWLVLGPVAVFAASTAGQALLGRDEFLLDARLWLSPMPEDLLTPGVLLADLVVTGYYPVLSWGAFLVLGLALGRLPLDRARVAAALLAAGALAWGAAAAAGAAVLRAPGVLERIAAGTGADPAQLTATLRTGEHRLAYLPPDPLWLALPTPHGGSPVAALLAAGWACAVLGLCLLVGAALDRALAGRTPADRGATPAVGSAHGSVATGAATGVGAGLAGLVRAAARPLTGAGRIPLTLYVGHLLVLAAASRLEIDASDAALLTVLVALCLAAGLAADLTGRRGPLESAVARLSRAGEADAPSPVRR
ncbi:heparan-alpha-glucosaminide N-acetyltransferase domain-containing protein [Micrococcus endophyticus]|uniref:heparan-alpha-glucosaminide N-acetyltransferase domain-containing protein n=1 Tax=Micrococcus endophyticus TaxID=455343 RepID=UPI0035A943A2